MPFDGNLSEPCVRERAPQHSLVGATECSWGAGRRWGDLKHTRDDSHGNTREGHFLGVCPNRRRETALWNQQLAKPGQRHNGMWKEHQGPTTESSVEALSRKAGLLGIHLTEFYVS